MRRAGGSSASSKSVLMRFFWCPIAASWRTSSGCAISCKKCTCCCEELDGAWEYLAGDCRVGPVIFSPSPGFGMRKRRAKPECEHPSCFNGATGLANRAKNHTPNVSIPCGGKNYRPVATLLAMTRSHSGSTTPFLVSSTPAGGRPALDENVIARSACDVAISILGATGRDCRVASAPRNDRFLAPAGSFSS
jgi:hypothetical protein